MLNSVITFTANYWIYSQPIYLKFALSKGSYTYIYIIILLTFCIFFRTAGPQFHGALETGFADLPGD